MDISEVKVGSKVITTELGSTEGMSIKPRHLDCRASGITGTLMSYVPGHGGDVWFVKHDGGEDIGAYCYTEFEPL